jgi:hypothetical protein
MFGGGISARVRLIGHFIHVAHQSLSGMATKFQSADLGVPAARVALLQPGGL